MKKAFLLVLLVFFLMGTLAIAEEQEQFRPLFSLSANGGTMRGEFTMNFETIYNQRWRGWGIQVSGMGNINKTIHEYGFSAGAWRQFGNFELGLFMDTLYLDKIAVYGYGGFHGQVRPEIRYVSKKVSLDVFYAHPFTRRQLLGKTVSAPEFWQDNQGYYRNIKTVMSFAKPVSYAGAELTVIPFKFVRVIAGGKSAIKEKNIYDFKAGLEFKITSFLNVSVSWLKMKASKAIGIFMGGDYQAVLLGIGLNFDRGQNKFSDLKKYDVFTPQYPVVIIKQEVAMDTAKIADLLKLDMTLNKKEVCLGTPVNFQATYSGGIAPYRVLVEFGDDQVTDESKGWHLYEKAGIYCIRATVTDSANPSHSKTDCRCVEVKPCDKPKPPECKEVKIISFTTSKTLVRKGEPFTLSWVTENGDFAYINDRGVRLSGNKEIKGGEITISCDIETKYVLRVRNKCSSTSKELVIMVKPY